MGDLLSRGIYRHNYSLHTARHPRLHSCLSHWSVLIVLDVAVWLIVFDVIMGKCSLTCSAPNFSAVHRGAGCRPGLGIPGFGHP